MNQAKIAAGGRGRGRARKLLQITKTNNNTRTTTKRTGEGDVIEFNQNCLVHQTDNYKQYILPISWDNPNNGNNCKGFRKKRKKKPKKNSNPSAFFP